MNRSLCLLAVCLLGVAPGLRAQQVELHGALELDHLAYFGHRPGQATLGRSQGELAVEVRTTFGARAATFSTVEFRADRAAPDRNRVYLEEAYLDLYLGRFDVRLGKQITVWGRTDGINPTDNLSPFDYADLLDTDGERLGILALQTSYFAGDWKLEGVVAPVFTPSRLPDPGARWFPALPPVQPHPLVAGEMIGATYAMRPADEPEGLRRLQAAARVSALRRGWDASLSYYHGWDDLPLYRMSALPAGPDLIRVSIRPEHHRLYVVGGDVAATAGAYGIRGEAAYFRSGAPDEPPYVQYVLGLDRTFGSLGSAGSLWVLVQWIHELSGGDRPEVRVLDLNHLFRQAFSTQLTYGLTSRLSSTLQGVFNLDDEGYYVQPELAYQATDRLDLRVSADVLGGTASSFFGSFGANDRVQVRVRYRF